MALMYEPVELFYRVLYPVLGEVAESNMAGQIVADPEAASIVFSSTQHAPSKLDAPRLAYPLYSEN